MSSKKPFPNPQSEVVDFPSDFLGIDLFIQKYLLILLFYARH